jgi:hypothetical protein
MITYLQLGRMGRLGNQMFEIAGTIGVARQSGQEFAFPEWKNYDNLERFGQNHINVQDYFVNPLPVLEDPSRYQFQDIPYYWGYRYEYHPTGNWNLNAHMQSDKFFKNDLEEVRHYFTMKDEVERPYTAIHWRAGDYEDNPEAYHPRLTKEYYLKAMQHVSGPYMIFSDDPVKCREILRIDGFYPDGDYLTDFKLMKSCKNFICANSSFSVMAAILANQPGKQIVCPKKWFGQIANLDTTDLYPENSIVI